MLASLSQARIPAVLTVALALAAAPARAEEACPPRADDPREADRLGRELFEAALQLEPSAPERALERLLCAETIVERPAVALRIGTIAERLGRAGEAADAFERYLARAGDAAPERAELEERIARLRREAAAPDTPGGSPPPGDAGPRPSPFELPGVVLLAIGGALAATGGGLLIAAKVHNDEVHGLRPGTTAWASDDARGKLERARAEQTAGIVALSVAGAATGVGIALLVIPGDGGAGGTAALTWSGRF